MDPTRDGKKSILLLQLGGVRDAVLSTPAFRAVKETFPGARLSVLVRSPIASLLEGDPHLDEIVAAPDGGAEGPGSWRETFGLGLRLRRSGHDLAVDLGPGDRGALLARLTGASDRVARLEPGHPFWRDWMFTRMFPDPPAAPPPVHPGADRYLRLLREVGIDTKDSAPRIEAPEKARERVGGMLGSLGLRAEDRWVTVSPFAGGRHKEWAPGLWADVIAALRERHGLAAVVVGTAAEAEAAEGIVRRFGGQGAFHLAGRTTLGELAALLARSTMHLGVDSAPSLVAAAVGVPAVTLFGPSKWKEWTVADETHRAVTADRACLACGRKGCADKGKAQCMEELGPDAVIRAAGEVLAAAGAG